MQIWSRSRDREQRRQSEGLEAKTVWRYCLGPFAKIGVNNACKDARGMSGESYSCLLFCLVLVCLMLLPGDVRTGFGVLCNNTGLI